MLSKRGLFSRGMVCLLLRRAHLTERKSSRAVALAFEGSLVVLSLRGWTGEKKKKKKNQKVKKKKKKKRLLVKKG